VSTSCKQKKKEHDLAHRCFQRKMGTFLCREKRIAGLLGGEKGKKAGSGHHGKGEKKKGEGFQRGPKKILNVFHGG